MALKTIYEYATKSWPIANGCSPNMPCAPRCWAKRTVHRLAWSGNPKVRAAHRGLVKCADGPGNPDKLPLVWTGTVRLNEAHLTDPLKWRKPQRVAVAYHGDLFRLPAEQIDRVFAVMALCPQHTFLVLTKAAREMNQWCCRLQKMADEWAPRTKEGKFTPADVLNLRWMHGTFGRGPAFPYSPWPLPNVHLGVSCENQSAFDERNGHLSRLIADGWLTWLSLEPMTGPIDVWPYLDNAGSRGWVVLGGESGPQARPLHPDWARSVRDQCAAAGVPFWFKQWGRYVPWVNYKRPYDDPGRVYVAGDGTVKRFGDTNRGQDLRDFTIMQLVPKKAVAGRQLDGREHLEMPEVKRG